MNNQTVEKIKYFEVYLDNGNNRNVIYFECLTRHDKDPEHLQRAIVRIPEFKTDIVPNVQYKNGTIEDNFKHSLASQIPGYKYKSLKDEYRSLTNEQYNETLLFTGSDESFPFKFTLSLDETE